MTRSKTLILFAGAIGFIAIGLIAIRHYRWSVIDRVHLKKRDIRVTDSSKRPALSVQTGHSAAINCVAFSPDSRSVVSGDDDGMAILWQIPSGIQLRRFIGHTSPILALAFSSDGRFVTSGSGRYGRPIDSGGLVDSTVRIWNVFSGNEIQRFENDADIVSVQFSKGDAQVLVASTKKVKIFDVKTGATVREFNPKFGRISAACFSPDNAYVAIATGTGVQIWVTLSGKPLRQLWDTKDSATEPIGFLAFSPDGTFLATGGDCTQLLRDAICLWDFKTGRLKKSWKNLCGPISFSSNGRFLLATFGGSGGTDVLDVNTGNTIALTRKSEFVSSRRKRNDEEEANEGETVAVDISHDLSYIIVATKPVAEGNAGVMSGDRSLRLFDGSTHREILEFSRHSEEVSDIQVSNDGDLITSFNARQLLSPALHPAGGAIWDARTASVVNLSLNRNDQSERLVAVSDDGKLAVTSSSRTARIWDLTTQSEKLFLPAMTAAWFSADHSRLLTWTPLSEQEALHTSTSLFGDNSYDTVLTVWDTNTWKKLWRHNYSRFTSDLAIESWLGFTSIEFSCGLSPDGRHVIVEGELYDVDTGVMKRLASPYTPIVTFSADSKYVILSAFLPDKNKDYTGVALYDVASTRKIWSVHTGAVHYVRFSPDSKYLVLTERVTRNDKAGTVTEILEVQTGKEYWRLEEQSLYALAFSHGGDNLFTVDNKGLAVSIWNLATKSLIKTLPGILGTTSLTLGLSKDATMIFAGGSDGQTHVLEVSTGKELCGLVTFADGTWVVVTPDGRFDTNNLEEIDGLHWIFPDDPLSPLPVEIFMREYYEPHLLSEVFERKQLDPLPALALLNRTQPEVRISAIGTPDESGKVQIMVTAENQISGSQRDDDGKPLESGVYDVRLFRDGHLVGSSTALKQSPASNGAPGNQTLDGWQEINALPLQGGRYERNFIVALPQSTDVKEVEFSAYAFNSDRVKSATARLRLPLNKPGSIRKGRAYIVAEGASAYENEALDLSFAANDALKFAEALTKELVRTQRYEDVVSIPLLSDYQIDGRGEFQTNGSLRINQKIRPRVLTATTATKDNFKNALRLLSGLPVADDAKNSIPEAGKIRQVTPDDIVFIFFSSHGDVEKTTGRFYLIPFDTGKPSDQNTVSPELLAHSISGDELAEWLAPVDAGEMVLIIDSCYAAATVETQGFKPGPFGVRGLGQLAYDKGIEVLAATQKDERASESEALQQGILTYALVHDGLDERQADFRPRDGQISLNEWLNYTLSRVPRLYQDLRAPIVHRPTLFDFERRKRNVVVAVSSRR
jgi:WD40 repeat protein